MVNWVKVGQFAAKFASKAFKWVTAGALGYEIGNSFENKEKGTELMRYDPKVAAEKKSSFVSTNANENVETILTMSVIMVVIICIAYLLRFVLRIVENRYNLRGRTNQAVLENP